MLSDTGAGSAGRAPERHPAAAPDHSGEGRGERRGGVVNIQTLSSSASLHDYNSSTQLTLTNGISFAHRTRNHLGRDD